MSLSQGQILQNRYQIVGLLGQGGMGSVYRAFDQTMSRPVAIKERIPDSNASPQGLAQVRAQFQREAQILGALSHPNLPHIYDFFSFGANEYVVMELIDGQSLDQVVQRHGAVDEQNVRIWAEQILDALTYVHARNIIHRDIKPANVIRKPDGTVVLVDFGLVKLLDPNNPYTATAMRRMGTPEYAPLEQFSPGMHTDARSDIYSLGAMLYHLLSGRTPLDVPRRLLDPALQISLRAINPSVSSQMEELIEKAMEVHPQNRYQTAQEMKLALSSPKMNAMSQRQTAPAAHTRTAAIPATGRALSYLGLMAAAFVVIVIGALGIGFFAMSALTKPTPSPEITADSRFAETRAASTAVARMTGIARLQPTESPSLESATNTPARTFTSTRIATTIGTRTRTAIAPIAPAASQKRFDFSKEGLGVVDIASGAQTKISAVEGIVTSAAWYPNGERMIVAWLKQGTVRQNNGQYVCGYSYRYGPYGWTYGPDYCNNPPDYFPSAFGGGLRLLSRSGDTISDLATGSPEPHFVGQPQISYSDAIWSPDGKSMAVLYKQADGNRCPFIGNSDAAGLRKLKDCEADDHPRFWSVDGKWLITWSERSPKLFAYDLEGGRRLPLEQLGRIQVYDERYFPWRVTDHPVCKGETGFWSCE